MIISVEELKSQVNVGETSDGVIAAKLAAIESVIRKYTNNNFQVRDIRFIGNSKDYSLHGDTWGFSVDDTVQVSSSINDGLYTVQYVSDTFLEVDKQLLEVPLNVVTKIKYPDDVKQCALNLYKWSQTMGDKVGIKSETISRHSVTYEDSATLYMGYPVGILNGLLLYRKARC